MQAPDSGAKLFLTDRIRKEPSDAGLYHNRRRNGCYRCKRGHRVSNLLIMLEKQKVPFHSISFSRQHRLAEAILLLQCMRYSFRLSLLSSALVRGVGIILTHMAKPEMP